MSASPMRHLGLFCFLVLAAGETAGAPSPDRTEPALLVVLSDTGSEREGLPVFKPAADGRRWLDVLERGFSGRVLRLYRLVQARRFGGEAALIEPAYLALTGNQGGFPRYGFFLEGTAKRGVAYIDLHRNSDLSGRFGATDQIFPHELMHVIVRQLAGEMPEGGANQVHAIGVRTDRSTAFNEGFAEAAQVLAADDPDAAPDTRALVADAKVARSVEANVVQYRRALMARWAPVPRIRMTFPLWFSQGEQVLRYHAVKANRFAFELPIRPRLLRGPDVYRAYLLENAVPGDLSGTRKPPGRMLTTEGVVAALFSRWVADQGIQSSYREESFYARFGVKPKDVPPLENAYLKLFHALERGKPQDAAALWRTYLSEFPQETTAVEAVLRSIGFDPHWEPPVEIWLANSAFKTGTTLFDQFRGLPREHTFDLNAASLADLMSIKGMTLATVEAIRREAPYTKLSDLQRVPAVNVALAEKFAGMEGAMHRLRAEAVEQTASLSLSRILMPYGYRAALWLVLSAVLAGLLYVRVRSIRWWRAILNGFSAALLGLGAAWASDAFGGAVSWLVPVAVCGLPGALWQLAWRKSAPSTGRVLAAWGLAALAPFLVTRAW
ncbi:MAG TPA: hypothetical protein VJA21_05380 [Verrucomicrobiae bacterium]